MNDVQWPSAEPCRQTLEVCGGGPQRHVTASRPTVGVDSACRSALDSADQPRARDVPNMLSSVTGFRSRSMMRLRISSSRSSTVGELAWPSRIAPGCR